MARVLLLTPPLIDFNAPYPATAYLVGYLRARSIAAEQADLSVDLACRLFSSAFLRRTRDHVAASGSGADSPDLQPAARFFLDHFADYEGTVDSVLRFLQGRDSALAHRIVSAGFCPVGPRVLRFLSRPEAADAAYGELGIHDRARCIAANYLVDLVDVIQQTVDPEFELGRYSTKPGDGFGSYEVLQRRLARPPSLVEDEMADALKAQLRQHQPDLVGITVPFSDNMPYALRCAQVIRAELPGARIAMGGGYVNTQLRELAEPALFDLVDYVTLDAGERPLECIVEHVDGRRPTTGLHRTFFRNDGRVEYVAQDDIGDVAQQDAGLPTYDGLELDRYFSFVSTMNRMDSIYYGQPAHKLTLAYGCYWKRCTFCDVTLDYIKRFDPAPVDLTIDRMRALRDETGHSAFHFVDEAAPPAVLKRLSQKLVDERMHVSWWSNIRFENAFTPELTALMARAGCIAVSGGLEVASDRLLRLIDKGVTVEQVARVGRSFSLAGITVHAYLIYGFPTETEQETIDSLEFVRQMFKAGCVHSAVWHRFSATRHSPIGQAPEAFGIRLEPRSPEAFDTYTVPFRDPTGTDHGRLGAGLIRALDHYREGRGLDADLGTWFSHDVPPTTVEPDFIARSVAGLESTRSVTGSWRRSTPSVWEHAVGNTISLMNVENGLVVSLSESAATIWTMLRRGDTVPAIVESLTREYDAEPGELEAHVRELISELAAQHFVRSPH